jgi:hypothetical protein
MVLKRSMSGMAVVLMISAVCQAEIVYDNFNTASAVFNGNQVGLSQVVSPNGFTRAITTSGAGLNGQVTGGAANFTMGGANSGFRMTYSNLGGKDLRSIQRILRFTATAAAGMKYRVDYAFTTASGIKNFTKAVITSTGAAKLIDFDSFQIPGSALLNVNALRVRITKTDNTVGGTFSIAGGIASVPEVHTMALLGLTAAVGGVIHIRRRKNAAVQLVC